jgi:PAS domain S-box-containing protein
MAIDSGPTREPPANAHPPSRNGDPDNLSEEALRKSFAELSARYRLISENADDVIWTLDLSTMRFTYVSPSVRKQRGFSPEEALQQTAQEVLTPESWAMVSTALPVQMDAFRAGDSRGRVWRKEVDQIRKDGSIGHAEIVTTLVADASGEPTQVVGVTRDITDRRRAEERIALLKHSIDVHFDGAFWFDSDNKFVYVNDAGCQALGFQREELLGKPLSYVNPRATEKVLGEIWEQLRREGRFARESVHRRKDGSEFPVEITSTYVQFGGKEYCCGFARDIAERKGIEESLQREVAMRGILLEHLPGAALIVRKETREIVCANEPARRSGAAPGKKCYEIWVHRDSPCPFCRAPEVWATDDPRQLEVEYLEKHFHCRWVPLTDELYVHYIFDITERKRAEEALQASQKRFKSIVEASPMGMHLYELASDGCLVFVGANPAADRILGVDHSRFVGRTIEEAFPGLAQTEVATRYKEAALHGTPWRTEQIEYKDGTIKGAFEVAAFQTEPGKMAALFNDITDRKRAEEALRQSEQNYRQVFNATSDAMIVHDENARILDVNERMLEMFGCDRDTAMGLSPNDLSLGEPPYSQAEAMEHFRKAIEDGPQVFEWMSRRRDGERFWSELAFQSCKIDGRTRVIASGRDITDRKRAQEALRHSEAVLSSIFEAASAGIILLENRVMRKVNPAFCKITGYSQDELLGRNAEMLFPTRQEYERAGSELYGRPSTEGAEMVESCFKRKDGSLRHVLLCISPFDPEDAKSGHTGVVLDISDRVKVQETLRESEERFRSLVENAPEAIFVQCRGRFTYLNPAMLRLFGASKPEELIGTQCMDRMAPEFHEAIRERIRFQRETGNTVPLMDLEYVRLNGSRVSVETTAVPIRFQGQDAHLVFVRDITRRKRAVQALREGRNRLDLAMGSSQMGAFQWDILSNKRHWDKAVCLLAGVRPETFTGTAREFLEVLHPEDRTSVQDNLKNALVTGNYETSYRVVWPDGSVHHIAARGRVIRDETDRPVRMLGVCWDITDRVRAEEDRQRLEAQYLQAQKMEAIGRLAAGVAHDFNNQLTVIQGYSDMLLEDRPQNDPLREPLAQIRQAAQRAQSTTSHLLSFSRKQILKAENVDLREFLREVEKPISRMIGEDIKLIVAAPPDVPAVFIDKPGLHQALMNLVVNARDAMPKGGELVLRTSSVHLIAAEAAEYPDASPGDYVLLEVIDSGIGMDRRTLELAFDPFFTTKKSGKGTGLGLPMVIGFVRQSKGFLGIRSKRGKGTAVRLLLPPAQHKVDAQKKPVLTASTKPHPNRTIMVVEDEEGVRAFVVSALERARYCVLPASGPMEALELWEKHKGAIDLLISDIVMPEMKGDELARKLKASRRGLQVLLITGYAEEGSHRGTQLLCKPFKTDELLSRVQSLLKRRRQRKPKPAEQK